MRWLLGLVVGLISFTATAFALPEDSMLDLARPVIDAISSGQYIAAAALLVVLAVAAARKYGSKRWPFLATDAGGSLLVLASAAAGGVASALLGGTAFSWGLVWASLLVAVSASGGYSLVKRLAVEPLRPLIAKMPGWLQPIMMMVLWIFDRPDVKAEADKAGADAVAANPGEGAAGVVGDAKEIN